MSEAQISSTSMFVFILFCHGILLGDSPLHAFVLDVILYTVLTPSSLIPRSDFIYMVPPFLAYYGVLTSNQSLVQASYDQIRLYRNYLRDDSASGLWKHVLQGKSGTDEGHWSTGNGWAAAGMLRVLSTIQNSEYDRGMVREQEDLAWWVQEIHNAMYDHLVGPASDFIQAKTSSHPFSYDVFFFLSKDMTELLFTNYADSPHSDDNFYDAASTALLASTVYRLSLLWGVHTHLPIAEQCRIAIFGSGDQADGSDAGINSTSSSSSGGDSSSQTSSLRKSTTATSPSHSPSSSPSLSSSLLRRADSNGRIDANGWLTPVVNPHSYGVEGSKSAEAQAFVVQLNAAWRDWVEDGSKGASGALSLTRGFGGMMFVFVWAGVAWAGWISIGVW